MQKALFYSFNLEDHVPEDHLLHAVDRSLDLSSLRSHLAKCCSHTDRDRSVMIGSFPLKGATVCAIYDDRKATLS